MDNDLSIAEITHLIGVLGESQIKVAQAIKTLMKFILWYVVAQLAFIGLFVVIVDRYDYLFALQGMFAATGCFLGWGIFRFPARIKAILRGGIAPTNTAPPR